MDQETLRETWAELCFHLSDNIRYGINENVFEQKVLFTLEKLLGWSQYRGEIKVKPSLQIGRGNFITPDIVLYVPDNKAAIVLEIKRPAEDLGRPGTFGQLQSYMRQTKAEFGFLVGNEILVYYDGTLSAHADPLLLSKICFKSDAEEGIDFVDLFNRNSFITGKYEAYLKAYLDRLERQQRVDTVRERILSEETSAKLLKFLKDEFTDIETPVLTEAMEGMTIKISCSESDKSKNTKPQSTATSSESRESIIVCKNRSSGKYFIYLESLKDHNHRLINPDGSQLDLSADLFEEPKAESVDYLLSFNLINEAQIERYNKYVSAQPEGFDASIDQEPSRTKAWRARPMIRANTGSKSPSPSAYEWSRNIPELSRLSDRVTWRAICDKLGVYVGGNSARRALKDWVRNNRRGWPSIPEP
jgi:hypothetical protein